MQVLMKQPVVVSNRPGANGAVGANAVATSPADGYTLLITTPSFPAVPAIDALYGRPAAYTLNQFVAIAQLNADPAILLVHPSLPVKTLKQFVALAKARPADVIITSSGAYGATHLPMAMLEQAAGIRMRHIPTTGGGPAMTNTLGGHATAIAAAPSVAAPHVRSGKIRAVAHWGAKRFALFPDLPTFKESGVDVEFTLWSALYAPAKTPPPVLNAIQAAVRQSVQDQGFKDAMEKANSTVAHLDGPQFAAVWEREAAKIQETVRFIGKVGGAN
jgi:tripartite-type tricarboxylate transporter receptor subunit TctC